MMQVAQARNVLERRVEVFRFTVGLACLTTLVTSTSLMFSWWYVTGRRPSLAWLALGICIGAMVWTALVTAAANPVLFRRFLWRKSLKGLGLLYCGFGALAQLASILAAVVVANRMPWLGLAVLVVTLPLAPMVLPVAVIGLFRRDSWWEDPLSCQACGYDLNGLEVSAPCPECGAARGVPPADKAETKRG